MNGGEVAYDWGTQAAVGGSPDGTLRNTELTDSVIGWINLTHTSSLGWIAAYRSRAPMVEANARAVQKSLGYRFVVAEASFPPYVARGGQMLAKLQIANNAAAPFYYRWPLQAALLRPDHSVAWIGTFSADITTWSPGCVSNVSQVFTLPGSLGEGTYTLALCIADPSGMRPSLRFANVNYYRGGWTPVGKVGVGKMAHDQKLDPFDDLKSDETLAYSK